MEIPNYKIEEKLGQGGMAAVYLATETLLNRKVALKIMSPELSQNQGFREGFRREGQTIAQLKHPNIVGIYSIGTVDDTYYMSMEYLSGGSLKDKLSHGKLTYDESIAIVEAVGDGLAHAHQHGFIHRDIKPANILFNENNTAVLTDFGIAKLQDTASDFTRMGYTAGTAQYMSPEQATTAKIDQRADIYCLGLVFYEMLTGEKAVYAETDIQAIHFHINAPPPSLPPKYLYLQPILDKALAKKPEDRFPTVKDFLGALSNSDSTAIFTPETLSTMRTAYTESVVTTENKSPKSKSVAIAATLSAIAVSVGVGIWYGTSLTDGPVSNDTGNNPSVNPSVISAVPAVGNNKNDTSITSDPSYFSQSQKQYQSLISELDEAARDIQEILALSPDNPDAKALAEKLSTSYYQLATDYLISGDRKRATTTINKAISYLPFHAKSYAFKKSIDNKESTLTGNQNNALKPVLFEIDSILEAKAINKNSAKLNNLYKKAFDIAPGNARIIDKVNLTLTLLDAEIQQQMTNNPEHVIAILNKASAAFPFNPKIIAYQQQIGRN